MKNLTKRWLAGWKGLLALVAVAVLVPVASEARAQDEDYGATYARVRYLEGQVTLQRTGESEVTEAALNDPLAPGDRIWTEAGRAEIALADGSILRLDDSTRLILRSLADIDNRYEKTDLMALQDGSIQVQVAEPSSQDAVFQIDSDGGSVYLLSEGTFRVDAEGGMTTVSSYRGAAELSGDAGSVLVRSGERSSVQRGRAPADPRAFNTLRQDDFDRFCENRAETYIQPEQEQAPDDVIEEIPEPVRPYYHELNFYGGWHNVPSYGWVWRPAYRGTWGPYVNGYWTWCPTGWVWVSYDPWGWAPYHYGRWDFTVDLGWFWIPGGVWGGGWVSFAVGTTYVGWCPLNYYNLPVFEGPTFVNVVNINVGRLRGRAWSFVPVGQFGARRGVRGVVRPDRLPRGTDLVVTGRLPHFSPREVAGHPDRGARFVDTVRRSRTPLPVIESRGGRPESFRTVETRTRPAGERRNPRQRMTPPAGRRSEGTAPPRAGTPSPRGQTPRERAVQPNPP
ncbi:MAG TPA: FecR family protein, partial [Candidatus Polarisedimenticolia bacterium]|nr:FecR family protein [Candidatus Polarisedimenticolia bacterium]